MTWYVDITLIGVILSSSFVFIYTILPDIKQPINREVKQE